jgi:hypothetical protein
MEGQNKLDVLFLGNYFGTSQNLRVPYGAPLYGKDYSYLTLKYEQSLNNNLPGTTIQV